MSIIMIISQWHSFSYGEQPGSKASTDLMQYRISCVVTNLPAYNYFAYIFEQNLCEEIYNMPRINGCFSNHEN